MCPHRRGKEALQPLQCKRVSLFVKIYDPKATLAFGKADCCTGNKIFFARPEKIPDRRYNASPSPTWYWKDMTGH